MSKKIHAEAPLDAQAAVIGLAVFAVAHNLDDFVILHIQIHLTPDAAIGAGGFDFL